MPEQKRVGSRLVDLERDEDGMWVALVPSIPGCISQGKSRQEALKNVKDAIEGCLEARAILGLPTPTGER
jgi:predicted RNase H-like HicB family nuclease